MVAALAAVLAAGCGGSGGGSGDADADADAVTTIRVPSWWFGEPGNRDWLNAAIEAFEAENSDVKVEGYELAFGDYTDQVLTEVSAGDPPDVLHLTLTNIGDFRRIGALAPLDEYLAESDIDEQTYVPAQWEEPLTVDGTTYGVIQMIANYTPFYNVDMLAEKGYDEFPADPESFYAMVEDIADPPEQYGYAAMLRPGSAQQTYLDIAQWVIANGGRLARDGEVTIDAPENVEALEDLRALYEGGGMPLDVDKSTYRQMWWEGKIGVIFDGSWMMGFAEDNNPDIVDRLDTAYLPWPGQATASTYQLWAVSEASPNKEEAFRFIAFLQSQEWQKEMIETTRAVSPRTDAMPEGFLDENPWFEIFDEAAREFSVPIMPPELLDHGNEVIRIVTGAFEAALYRGTPVADALATAQAEVEAVVGD